ncbi:MAG: electron transfer flavoprotein subunit beta/FixA family protein [Acidimicrobiales bacterium]
MKIAVCVKQIPDPEQPVAYDESSHTLVRTAELAFDDSDSYGVEMALRLAAEAGDADVTVVSMAPDGSTSGLRSALAMGAENAVLISDPALAASDALATARVLAAAISRIGAELVVAATESTDGYTGTVPVQIAENLGYPVLSYVRKVELAAGKLKAERQTAEGFDEVACSLPALISVTAGVVEVRYPTFKGIMSARSKPVETLTLADLGVDASAVGRAGGRQEVVSIEDAPDRGPGEVLENAADPSAEIVERLKIWKVL